MNVSTLQSEKIERYMRNANPFLWGVLEASNKGTTITEVQGLVREVGKIFTKAYPTYDDMLNDLLLKLHVDGIIEKIILEKLTKRIGREVLEDLKHYWIRGRLPDLEYLEAHHLYREQTPKQEEAMHIKDKIQNQPAEIFFNIVHQYRETHYTSVREWKAFGGLWFEEIEPYLSGIERMKSV